MVSLCTDSISVFSYGAKKPHGNGLVYGEKRVKLQAGTYQVTPGLRVTQRIESHPLGMTGDSIKLSAEAPQSGDFPSGYSTPFLLAGQCCQRQKTQESLPANSGFHEYAKVPSASLGYLLLYVLPLASEFAAVAPYFRVFEQILRELPRLITHGVSIARDTNRTE